jgi:nucleotide-binding universal stress UspA family protein
LFAYGGSQFAGGIAEWMPASVKATSHEVEQATVAQIEAQFRERTADAPADKIHFIESGGLADRTVAEYARLYDLTLLGGHDTRLGDAHLLVHPDVVAIRSGRPVLVFPKGFTMQEINEHALIAWDGQRAAARALADAMQILETKEQVTLLTVEGGMSPELPGTNVVTHLERHGVRVMTRYERRISRLVGRVILDTAQELDVGLIVMGAFEHSKFRENHFGGVSNTVLHETRTPVLMAH